MAAELNANQEAALRNLEKRSLEVDGARGCSWRSAVRGTNITTEQGARYLLARLADLGLAEDRTNRFYITEAGVQRIKQVKQAAVPEPMF